MTENLVMDPYSELHQRLTLILSSLTSESPTKISWLIQPPKRGYGDLSIPLIRFSKKYNLDINELYNQVINRITNEKLPVKEAKLERGYLNLIINIPELMRKLGVLLKDGWSVRLPKVDRAKRIVVEHTSANPIHPIHIGHARNTCIGDTLSRLLKSRGHIVNTRFYVDDVGKQVAIAAFGFRVLGIDPLKESLKLGIKPDHFVGWVYAVTFTILDTLKAKTELEEEKDAEKRKQLAGKLDDLLATLAELKERDPSDYFDKLLKTISSKADPESEIQEIMRRYERGLEPEKSLVRSVTNAVLDGFRQTLSRMGVHFDSWDWESDIVWSSRVRKIIEEAKRSPYYVKYKETDAIDIPKIIKEVLQKDPEASSVIKVPKGWEIPPLILVRADGTTLYTTRDLAYTLYKFEAFNADQVINVIGADQRLAQLQLRLALLGLGYRKEALNLIHYDYEIVALPGERMSSRRGRLVDIDGVLDSLRAQAAMEVTKRNKDAPTEWIEDVAEKIAVGALRFALVRTNAKRPIVFDPSRALSLEENSGPYLQYTYARASSIMSKHGPIDYENVDYNHCDDPKRRSLILLMLQYPLTAAKAADDLAPEDLASYLLKLADEFNSWYQVDPVIRETNVGARECKAVMVEYFRQALGHGLYLLGVPAPDRM